MAFAIRIHQTGGPEQLRWEDVGPTPKPGPDEVLIRNHAAGLNFMDVYLRTGAFPEKVPFIPGAEGAGTIEAIGSDVNNLRVGDNVAYVGKIGAYAQFIVFPADRVVKLPREIDLKIAAAIMLKGMTAEYLLRRTYPVKSGDTILIHAAAGGVGGFACQWAKHLGATVIGTVGSETKVKFAKQNGCDHVIVTDNLNFAHKVRDVTKGAGVKVVYDGIGKDTFMESLDCIEPFGMMVSYGGASGEVPPFSIATLSAKGSLYLARPSLMSYIAKPADLQQMADELFSVITQGVVKVAINQTYPMQNAAEAHKDLEARKTTGSTVLLVE